MSCSSLRWLRRTLGGWLCGAAGLAAAAPITINGSLFDVTYDDTLLGRYSAPTLVGDALVFTTNRLLAESLNGQGLVSLADAVSGIVVTAKGNFRLGAVGLAAFGDYLLSGSGSSVQVSGQLDLFDAFGNAVDSAALQVDAGTPLNLADGRNRDWAASAAAGSFARQTLGLRVGTTLSAFTQAGPGLQQAVIEQKFAGLQLSFVRALPAPSTLPLVALAMVLGLGCLAARRREPKAPWAAGCRVTAER